MDWRSLLAQSVPSAFGTSFALLLGLAVWLYRKNRERKETLSRALYNLLVVWEAISKSVRMDFEEVQRALFEEALRRANELPEGISDAEEAVERLEAHDQYDPKLLKEFAQKATRLSVPGGLEAFSTRLEDTISTLSATEPLLAYSLTREYDIDRLLTNVHELLEATGDILDFEEIEDSRYVRLIEDLLTERMLTGIEKDIKRLARKVGPWTWLRTTWKLWRTRRKHKTIDPDRVREYVDKLEKYGRKWLDVEAEMDTPPA